MIVGKDTAVGAPREVVPAAADFSIQEPSLTQLKTMFSEKILVSGNRATDERASAAQLLALTDVFHNDDCISGDAANVLDQRLEHGRIGNVVQYGYREAQIDRVVLEGQVRAVDLGKSDIPERSQVALRDLTHRLRNIGTQDELRAMEGCDVSQVAARTGTDLHDCLRLEIDRIQKLAQKSRSFVAVIGIVVACEDVVARALLDLLADPRPVSFGTVGHAFPIHNRDPQEYSQPIHANGKPQMPRLRSSMT